MPELALDVVRFRLSFFWREGGIGDIFESLAQQTKQHTSSRDPWGGAEKCLGSKTLGLCKLFPGLTRSSRCVRAHVELTLLSSARQGRSSSPFKAPSSTTLIELASRLVSLFSASGISFSDLKETSWKAVSVAGSPTSSVSCLDSSIQIFSVCCLMQSSTRTSFLRVDDKKKRNAGERCRYSGYILKSRFRYTFATRKKASFHEAILSLN